MATIYGKLGSLTELFYKLNRYGIDSITSLEDILLFKNNFNNAPTKILQSKRAELLDNIFELNKQLIQYSTDYKNKLDVRETQLKNEIYEIGMWLREYDIKSKQWHYKILNFYKHLKLKKRVNILKYRFEEELRRLLIGDINRITAIKNEIEYKKTNTDKLVHEMSESEIKKLNLINSIIEENKTILCGAIGENNAQKELQKLPSTYAIINDFRREFDRPLYYKKNDDYIYSVQIDHIVVGPTGVFIIETKNWSQNSVNNLDLFSPVKQLHRSSYAIFLLLNKLVNTSELDSFNNHWGAQKISPKNIILMMNHKPSQEFQYVRVLTLPEVNRYILTGERVFSNEQVNQLVNLLKLS